MNAIEIMKRIRGAGFKMNGYAQSYFNNFPEAEEQYGERGLKSQVLYFFSNQKARTPEQKNVKKELLVWAGYKGYR